MVLTKKLWAMRKTNSPVPVPRLEITLFQILENGDEEEFQTLEIPDASRELVELLLEVT